jgi:hypothetical protein
VESVALFMAHDITEVATKLLLPSQTIGVLIPMFLAMWARRGRELGALATAPVHSAAIEHGR